MTLGPLMVDVAGKTLTAEDRELLRHPLVGSVILFTRNYENPDQLAALVADIRGLRSPPLLVAVDHEGGRVQRFRTGFSVIPPARRVGLEYDLDPKQGLALAGAMGWLMAAELRAFGIDFSFAPCVDLDFGVSEIIGDRAYHADAETVSRLALAVMQGMRKAGMAATAKHFPGHGAVVADLLGQLLDAPKRTFNISGGEAVTIDGRGTRRVLLVPRVDGSVPFQKATLWLDDKEPRPARVQVIDPQGVERTITLTTWIPNATLPKNAFVFTPPKGVRVITKIPGS